MAEHILLPVLEDMKRRLERIEKKLEKGELPEKEEKTGLASDEIQEYLKTINMA